MRKSWKTVERMIHRQYCKQQCDYDITLFHKANHRVHQIDKKRRKIRYNQRRILQKTMNYETFNKILDYCQKYEVWNNHLWDNPFDRKIA